MARDKAQGDAFPACTYQNGWMGTLHRLRVQHGFVKMVVPAGEAGALLCPQLLDDHQGFVQPRQSLSNPRERNAIFAVLSFEPTCANTKNQATTADDIDSGRHLSQYRRMTVGVARDHNSQANVLGGHSQGSKRGPAFHAWASGIGKDG